MERREAVKYISILLGGAVIGADAFLSGCKTKTGSKTDWTEEDVAFLNEVGETILPRTTTPGAKDANVGKFMTTMVNDCYLESDQKVFREGLDKLNEASKTKFDNSFMKISPQQRQQLLTELDKEAKDYQKKVNDFNSVENKKDKDEKDKGNLNYVKQHMSPHYFFMMKQLTLLGFFTSKEGMTQAVRYLPVPGRYEGDVPYKKGDKLIV
ncbi:MAG: gluconate 2-dehydrogenase subunit 3 family protein [Chitinophagaceae bacterium]|nr:MAG: gluconate 2-dehydrogenase subunit 3 family protein [Chitinophagaceae bacterium]